MAENIIEWICFRQNNGSLFADGENRNGLELSCVFLRNCAIIIRKGGS